MITTKAGSEEKIKHDRNEKTAGHLPWMGLILSTWHWPELFLLQITYFI
jgi:hypothetical protein